MSWTTSAHFDADKVDVGVLSATWTDPVHGVFTHARRLESGRERNAFAAEAIAARDAWLARKGREASAATALLDRLNEVDL